MEINENTYAPSLIEACPATYEVFRALGVCCAEAVVGTVGDMCRQYGVEPEGFIEVLKMKADEF